MNRTSDAIEKALEEVGKPQALVCASCWSAGYELPIAAMGRCTRCGVFTLLTGIAEPSRH